jgi:PAS domain-containing protein
MIHPEDRAATQAALDRASDPTGKGEYHQEFRIIRPIDGIERWLSAYCQIYFEAGHAVRHLGTLQDITERKQAADALKKSREKLKTFIHQAPLSIAMFDRDMNYLEYSSRWLEQYGRGYDDLIGHNHYEVHPDLPDEWKFLRKKVADNN